MKFVEILRTMTVDMDADETLYDGYSADEETQDMFIANIKAQLTSDDFALLEKEINSETDLKPYIDEDDENYDEPWLQIICTAAFCMHEGIEIDEDTCVQEDEHVYNIHWNQFNDMYTEYEIDIDLG